jgi:uncharacterized protein
MIAALLVALALAGCGGAGSSSTATKSAGSEVSFVVDGTTTYGTLTMPRHPAGHEVAAALLIPGSGPTDRDGNDTRLGLTADTLGLVAELLAEDGIASLRYDKYFSGRTGAGSFADDPASFTIAAQLHQAEAAYDFLAGRPGVDPGRLLIVGHSEGGMVALSLAGSVAAKPAGLALLEPQDLRHLDLVRIQADEHLAALVAEGSLAAGAGRADQAEVASAIARFREGAAVSRAELAPPVAALLAPELLTPDNAAFDRSHDRIVPAALAARVRPGTRVLFTDGTRDANVPPSTVGPLDRALVAAGTTGPGLTVLKGTDHLMHLASQPDSEAVLAPAAIAAIQAWAKPYSAPR